MNGQDRGGRGALGETIPLSRREIRKEITVEAPAREVWERWTTAGGVESFFAPSAAIDLAVGGAYELHFDPDAPAGSRGSEGCVLLSLLPERMLSFTWNAPPHLPAVRDRRTWVVVLLDREGPDSTRVTLVHLGWRSGGEWDEAYAYFDRAWSLVLERLGDACRGKPMRWGEAP